MAPPRVRALLVVRPTMMVATQCCRHKTSSSSSSSSMVDFLPQSVKDLVKSSFLEKANSADSSLWVSSSKHIKPNGEINGSHHHHHHQQQHLDRLDHFSSRTATVSRGNINGSSGVNDPVTSWDDPLLDLHLGSRPATAAGRERVEIQLPASLHPLEQADPFVLAHSELATLSQTIRDDLLGTDHPVLNQAAAYFFNQDNKSGGKQVRPMMVLLLSRALADAMSQHPTAAATTTAATAATAASATNSPLFTIPFSWQRSDLPQAQRRLAEISEMIHTASLFHDDVIDGADTRRGFPALHKVFGNKMAILAGDYLLARASISLARLRHVEVIESMSTIIEHLVRGEVMQLKGVSPSTPSNSTHDSSTTSTSSSAAAESRLQYYLRKNFYKTGSLMANSCKSAALLGDYPTDLVQAAYRYGKHVGMAFQLVDDVLDFEGSAELMGKPALSDLKAGIATAPVLFALEEEELRLRGGTTSYFSSSTSLHTLIQRKFRQEGDVERAVEIVMASHGVERTKQLAQEHAERAIQAAMEISPVHDSSNKSSGSAAIIHNSTVVHRDALIYLAYKVIHRTK